MERLPSLKPRLIDYFEPEDAIGVNRVNGRSEFQRLSANRLKQWMDDYSLGDLWEETHVRAGPTHE